MSPIAAVEPFCPAWLADGHRPLYAIGGI